MQPFSLLDCKLYILSTSYCSTKCLYETVRRCHVVVYIVMGIIVDSESSPSPYIRGLVRRIDRGIPNASRTSSIPQLEFKENSFSSGDLFSIENPNPYIAIYDHVYILRWTDVFATDVLAIFNEDCRASSART